MNIRFPQPAFESSNVIVPLTPDTRGADISSTDVP